MGSWYMTASGQLIKVWATCISNGLLETVVIEFLNGRRSILSLEDWVDLDVEIHLYSEAM